MNYHDDSFCPYGCCGGYGACLARAGDSKSENAAHRAKEQCSPTPTNPEQARAAILREGEK